MDHLLHTLRTSWFIPAIIFLLLIFVAARRFHISVTDVVADRVIQKLNADYMPYGPPPPADSFNR
jgi:hypothetical protein